MTSVRAAVEAATLTRQHVAGALERPHAEEQLLADVLLALEAGGGLEPLVAAFGLTGPLERVTLWGHDVATGAEDSALSLAVMSVHPRAGVAVRREAEPDLIVATPDGVACVEVAVDRPGHGAARALRGEAVPAQRLDEVAQVLGGALAGADLASVYPAARSLAVARAVAAGRHVVLVAVAAGGGGLMLGSDRAGAWADMASRSIAATASVGAEATVVRWRDLAAALRTAGAADAAAVIEGHPTAGR